MEYYFYKYCTGYSWATQDPSKFHKCFFIPLCGTVIKREMHPTISKIDTYFIILHRTPHTIAILIMKNKY